MRLACGLRVGQHNHSTLRTEHPLCDPARRCVRPVAPISIGRGQAVCRQPPLADIVNERAAPTEVGARLAGSEVQILVEDRGPGVPPGDVTRIFDKFYRVQHEGVCHGAGLGLAISHGIIDAHRGRIWAANRPDGGAIVAFALPVRPSESPHGGAGTQTDRGDRAPQWATPGRAS